jgi:hypothetical protein
VVGITPDKEPLVRDLVRAIVRTVSPDSWLAMGGKGSIQPVFNGKAWFLLVTNETATISLIEQQLDKMKLPV